MKPWRAAALALLAALSACHGPQGPGFTAVSFADLPGWSTDHQAAALAPLRAGCAHLDRPEWRASCAAAAGVPDDDAAARAFFAANFTPWRISDAGSAAAEFTGYYEPEMAGSRTRDERFQTALLGRPADLVQVDLGDFAPDLKGRHISGRVSGSALQPYWTRAEIEAGALDAQHLELLFLADPVDAFFLQVQGSGRVDLPDGQMLRVGYAAQNGRAYVAIGRKLVERGALSQDGVSMQSIRAWLAQHPQEVRGLLDENPSYVFFHLVPGAKPDEGPRGALGVALTPGRSLAVDRRLVPLGAPVWIDTTDPDGGRLQRLMLAQDVGGAIKGLRGDIFFGWGPDAERRAGLARQAGTEYVLLPNGMKP